MTVLQLNRDADTQDPYLMVNTPINNASSKKPSLTTPLRRLKNYPMLHDSYVHLVAIRRPSSS
jgi:hypothetical protein